MAKQKQPEIAYCGREESDAELVAAIRDIRSAEEEAKRIIDDAEQAVKQLRLQSNAKERELREEASRTLAAAREGAVREATERAERDCAKKMSEATRRGAELVESKRAQIDRCIAKLYAELIGR